MPIFKDHFILSLFVTLSGWIVGMCLFFALRRNPEFGRKIFGHKIYEKMEKGE